MSEEAEFDGQASAADRFAFYAVHTFSVLNGLGLFGASKY